MFGGFQSSWTTGISQFSDLSEKVQKLRTGLEAGLQDSGLLGPGEIPHVSESEPKAKLASNQATELPVACSSSKQSQNLVQSGSPRAHDKDIQSKELTESPTANPNVARTGGGTYSKEESGWDDSELEVFVPESPEAPVSTDGAIEHTRQDSLQGTVVELLSSSYPQQNETKQLENDAEGLNIRGYEDASTDLASFNVAADNLSVQDGNEDHGKFTAPATTSYAKGARPLEDAPQSSPSELANSPPGDNLPILENGVSAPKGIKGGAMLGDRTEKQIEEMSLQDLQAWSQQLQSTLQAREKQLERKFEEVANMQDVTQQLVAKNEELARKAARASEEDIKQLTDEYEVRLGAAERKVYALTKERDMLKRGSENLSSANDLLKEKDNIIAQVMAEGEQLSKKQLAQESTIKKLRQHVKEVEFSRKELAATAAADRQLLEASGAAKQKAEGELSAARQAHRAELEAERAHYDALLAKARTSQIEAEQAAAASAKEGLSRKLRESETRTEMLCEQIADLQADLERQRAAAELREEALAREVAAAERRRQEAEASAEEVAGRMPEATRPLLRQLEAMQRSEAAHSQAWAAADQALHVRLSHAQAQAAAAGERERLASERLQAADSRANSAAAALEAVRDEYDALQRRCSEEAEQLVALQRRCLKLEAHISQLQGKLAAAEMEKLEAERTAQGRVEDERQANLHALVSAESRVAALEERLRSQTEVSAAAEAPPAAAAPGFMWVLVREGEDEAAAAMRQQRPPAAEREFPASGPELERLQDALQQKEEQLSSFQDTIAQLEATRDSLAEELVSLSQTSEQHATAWKSLEQTRAHLQQTTRKLAACTELLGEREEKILELTADIVDMKALYRDQIEFVLGQLSVSRSPSRAASSVSSWVPTAGDPPQP